MRIYSPLFAVTFLLPLSAQQPIAAEAAVKKAEGRGAPVQPVSQTVALSQDKPANLPGLPELADAWFGTATVAGKKIAIAVGKSNGDAELTDTLVVDANANGSIDANEKMALDVTQRPGRGENAPPVQTAQAVEFELKAGAKAIGAQISYVRMGDGAPRVSLSFPNYLESTVDIGGTSYVVAVLDQDLDGTFGSGKDLWGVNKAGGRPLQAYALMAMGEHVFTDGTLIGIKIEKPDVVQVTTKEAAGPLPQDEAAQRVRAEHIWAERFHPEREGFIKQRNLDTSRPLAKQPIDWQYVTFDEAIALGKKANKPVFIDVMAFWCVWCYRMDYYTYPDQEVAQLLNEKFIPVKIIQEQDRVGDYDKLMKEKLQARGIPAMGIFGTDGNVLHTIGGWKKPEDFIAELKQGLEKFESK